MQGLAAVLTCTLGASAAALCWGKIEQPGTPRVPSPRDLNLSSKLQPRTTLASRHSPQL